MKNIQELINLEASEKRGTNKRIAKGKNKINVENLNAFLFGDMTEEAYYASKGIETSYELRHSDAETTTKTKSIKITWHRKNTKNLSESERMSLGLSTGRKPGVYYGLTNGYKICTCCQKRKPADFFSNSKDTRDGKVTSCKDCEYLRGKSYRAEKFN